MTLCEAEGFRRCSISQLASAVWSEVSLKDFLAKQTLKAGVERGGGIDQHGESCS